MITLQGDIQMESSLVYRFIQINIYFILLILHWQSGFPWVAVVPKSGKIRSNLKSFSKAFSNEIFSKLKGKSRWSTGKKISLSSENPLNLIMVFQS